MMTENEPVFPKQLFERAGGDETEYRRLMVEYGWILPPRHPDRETRARLGVRSGFRITLDNP